ncbi:hypothetical protein NQZ68_037079 [Dissostichus eleginoides]|nr:hypothetical protein NQZ68_037079 [Dissostichus eleginoides]
MHSGGGSEEPSGFGPGIFFSGSSALLLQLRDASECQQLAEAQNAREKIKEAVKQAGGVCRILCVVSIPGGKAAEENGVGLIEILLKRKGQSFLETAVAVIMPAVWSPYGAATLLVSCGHTSHDASVALGSLRELIGWEDFGIDQLSPGVRSAQCSSGVCPDNTHH